jgi:hypothetical protein
VLHRTNRPYNALPLHLQYEQWLNHTLDKFLEKQSVLHPLDDDRAIRQ